jgi:glycosyltransferase involved in cell wall biosynthesis
MSLAATKPDVGIEPDGVSLQVAPPKRFHEGVTPFTKRPTLTIVIPALNEEESIGSTIQRCLDAREHIKRKGNISDIEIIVVSDGSTDRTAEIAREYAARDSAVSLIVFPQNRGYGAALKEGFRQGTGELVSFLDADGTCDPLYFADLCQALQDESAALVLGSRMGAGNQMPRLRRLGNRLYAFLLGFLSGQAVSDTASGMRVLSRDALPSIYPLPDGLHFTPAMSARALMSGLPIIEVPMTYTERVGESKLHVLRDGVRFLFAILSALLLYRPSKLFSLGAALCLVVGTAWILYPVEFYLGNHRLEEWMIYRVLLTGFLLSCAFVLLGAGVLSERILTLVHRGRRLTFVAQILHGLFSPVCLAWNGLLAVCVGTVLVWPGLVEYIATSHTSLHWSRAIIAVFLFQVALVAWVMAIVQKVVALWKEQLEFAKRENRES